MVTDIFLAIYIAMTLAWAWPPERFLVVVWPLILCLVWRVWRASPLSADVRRVAGIAILAGVTLQCLWNLVDSSPSVLNTEVVLAHEDQWRDAYRQLNWS
jgi:hypothetical protein